MVKIEYSSWGLANRINDVVVLNENLKKYPALYKILLDHELSHDCDPLNNIIVDLNSIRDSSVGEVIMKLKFMLKYPKTLVQMSPIWIYKKRPYFDLSLLLIYLLIVLVVRLGGVVL